MDNDFRWITNSKQPVVKPQDLEGMSLRVPEIPELIQFFNELDAQPTTMAVTEVVPALQQGAVDGQDNGAILNYTFGFYEFQPYMTITNHVFSGGGIIINNNLWNNLSSKNKQIIKDSARECFAEGNAELRSKVALYTKKMKEKGVQVDTPSPELEAAMEKAARAVYENPKNVDRYGKEVMNKILNQ
jgi:TRAP-type C4-dicarboxylate transport system substrate-binding protein